MAEIRKASATIANVPLAATSGIAWQFVSGVAPYMTTLSVHVDDWPKLKDQLGQPVQLKITDSRGVDVTINQVYILHAVPSDSPHRAAFVVADKRWKWGRKLIVRDFNMPRKTGDRTGLGDPLPAEVRVTVDEYDYLPYSLKPPQGTRWTAREALEDVLEQVEGDESGGFEIESFPIANGQAGNSDAGEFTLQGITLRDPGDAALARLLSYVPGADIYVRADGRTVLFDGTDIEAAKQYLDTMQTTWAGEAPVFVDRAAIRPRSVLVHYEREFEIVLDFEDDYSGNTAAQPVYSQPYLENVLPTVDRVTTLYEFDPIDNVTRIKHVDPGTWVPVDKWLEAMDRDRPDTSLPWTFDTIKTYWFRGDLEGVLGAGGKDFDPDANIALRVQTLRQHFRQTFRVNRRFMLGMRSLRAVRVGMLDPVTGARAPAGVWGQACIVPASKWYMTRRGVDDPSKLKVLRNVNYLAPSENGAELVETPCSPAHVNIVDEELGIFSVHWAQNMAGLDDTILPCMIVDNSGEPAAPVRDLALQDSQPMGAGMQIEDGTNGIFLDDSLHLKVVLTMVPSVPNNANQYYKIEVDPNDVADVFRTEYGIAKGKGPPLEVFVPPGEITARFAIAEADEAYFGIGRVLGLVQGAEEGEESEDGSVPGYELTNGDRQLPDHALSVAAELLAAFADAPQGSVATSVPDDGIKLRGNMSGATLRVAGYPSAKVDVVHDFPGQQRAIPRLAFMPDAVRRQVLGIVAFR